MPLFAGLLGVRDEEVRDAAEQAAGNFRWGSQS